MLINNTVNYKRETVRQSFTKYTLRVKNYSDIDSHDFIGWLDKIKNDKDIKEVSGFYFNISEEPSGGCTAEYDIIEITPYVDRLETDAEYHQRIKEDEEELKHLEEIRRQKEQYNKEYLKDMEEYKRIKKKYNLW